MMSDELRTAAMRLVSVVRVLGTLEKAVAPAVAFDRPDPLELARIQGRYHLPESYVTFLQHYASEDFDDAGLSWRGVSCSPSTVKGFATLHESYAGQDHWPADWIVIAFEHEGCYFLDLGAAGEKEPPVRYLDHGVGDSYDEVADSLVGFLQAVIQSSEPEYDALGQAIAAGDREQVAQSWRCTGLLFNAACTRWTGS